MQSKSVTDEKSLTIFKDSQTRIKSMALVHEKLYKTKEFSRINIAEYVINLVNYVHQTYSSDAKIIKTVYDLDNIELPIDIATPLGLIINELILNIFKYAFVDSKNGKDNIINIRAKQLTPNPSSILFEVSDNGVGLPKDFSIEESNSLGLKLVFNLCQQIDAKLNIESDNGTKFSFTITERD
jgi:two-component sensor histidine kinase